MHEVFNRDGESFHGSPLYTRYTFVVDRLYVLVLVPDSGVLHQLSSNIGFMGAVPPLP